MWVAPHCEAKQRRCWHQHRSGFGVVWHGSERAHWKGGIALAFETLGDNVVFVMPWVQVRYRFCEML
jgi:hypothetical protein